MPDVIFSNLVNGLTTTFGAELNTRFNALKTAVNAANAELAAIELELAAIGLQIDDIDAELNTTARLTGAAFQSPNGVEDVITTQSSTGGKLHFASDGMGGFQSGIFTGANFAGTGLLLDALNHTVSIRSGNIARFSIAPLRTRSNNTLAIQNTNATGDALLTLELLSSTGAAVNAAALDATAIDNTHATRKYRSTLSAYDAAAAREGIRVDATGTAAALGFYGATAVTKQTLPAAASDAATTQALANALRTALINLGLCD